MCNLVGSDSWDFLFKALHLRFLEGAKISTNAKYLALKTQIKIVYKQHINKSRFGSLSSK